jgi:hypothetical protein
VLVGIDDGKSVVHRAISFPESVAASEMSDVFNMRDLAAMSTSTRQCQPERTGNDSPVCRRSACHFGKVSSAEIFPPSMLRLD